MIVSEIKNIQTIDSHIYYRQIFTAIAVYTILGGEREGKIEFTIEYKPTGETEIQVKMIDKLDYPVLQVMIELKNAVRNLIKNEQLPKP
ncbi:hypothetical protein [Treponema pedis]|uniref:Uncharacterized protein n=2 Tax=Treponema pedis TaxID=409322 RepID=S6A8Z4_9SPIR|nr:hypothetical protein [Treponema pedis]AGT44684.1 hypothetical protein TPE_2210 [Treponema pedis str. T A4]QOW60006.1 hypothetical protein IFE08_09090 [Treponema pedis]QSI05346.1 hypothetical protein DYQ05_10695 [Treponema pedis]